MSNSHKEIAAKLRELADKYDEGPFQGPLTFNVLGDVWGNEFWNLIAYHTYPGDERTFTGMMKAVLEEVAYPWIERAVRYEMQKRFPRDGS